jgi:hypothetical protein
MKIKRNTLHGEDAAEQIRRKEHGCGTLGALERARRERAEEWARCNLREDGEAIK